MQESKYKRAILPGKQEAAGAVMSWKPEESRVSKTEDSTVSNAAENNRNNLKNTHYTHFKDAINGRWIPGIF